MYIKNGKLDTFNFDKARRLYVDFDNIMESPTAYTANLEYPDGSSIEVARYLSRDNLETVMCSFYKALEAGKAVFEFPYETEEGKLICNVSKFKSYLLSLG